MRAYPEYKDSGVEWLGEVPSHWSVRRLKYHAPLVTDKAISRSNAIGLENIESWTGRYLHTETEFEGLGVAFKKGDLLFGKLRPYLAKIFLAKEKGGAVGDFHVLRPVKSSDAKFLQYHILTKEFISIVDGSTYGTKMPRASWGFVGYMHCSFPPMNEQKIIAKYLDRETTRIDKLISEKQNFIKLLKEKRQALISHVVTKGLDPHVKMKDSGIEWIGEVPEHWEVKPLKMVGNILSGYAFNSSSFIDNGIKVLKISNVQTLALDWTDQSYVGAHLFENLKRFAVLNGDIVFALTRPIISTGIKAAIANIGSEKILLNQRNAIFRLFDGYMKTFFYHVLFSQFFISQFENSIDATGQQPNISPTDIGKIKVLCPPFHEQDEITNYLNFESSRIDGLLREVHLSMDLLKEHRTALISAAVTGKIDVRDQATECSK